MRIPFLFVLAAILATLAAPGEAQRHGRDQDRAFQAAQQGNYLPLGVIRARNNIPGAEYIGAELIGDGIYRLKFMRGSDVIWIDVDARTGRRIR